MKRSTNINNNFFEQKQIEIEESLDIRAIKDINQLKNSFDKEINLENFLLTRFEGLNESDNEECKNDDNGDIKEINDDLYQDKEKENSKSYRASQEIFEIIRKSYSDKANQFKNSPFKRLIVPKKISLSGRILFSTIK